MTGLTPGILAIVTRIREQEDFGEVDNWETEALVEVQNVQPADSAKTISPTALQPNSLV